MINLHFLIVDDDQDFLNSAAMILSTRGLVTTVTGMTDACQVLCKHNFDLLLIDYNLVDGNGCDLIRLIKDSSSREIPIILTSGYASKEMAIQAIDLQVVSLLEKPFSATTLLDKVTKILKISDLQDPVLNPNLRCVVMNNKSVELTSTEFKLLSMLLENKNKQLDRENIEIRLWGKTATSKNTLDTHLYNLKKKVPALKDKIKTIHGAGLIYYS